MSDAAIVCIVTGVVTIVTLWIKMKYGEDKVKEVEKKLDQNTKITQDSAKTNVANTKAAVETAKVAAEHAADTKVVADNINRKLNGGIDAAIIEAVKPIKDKLDEHCDNDDRNMKDINEKLAKLDAYVHTRNHDVLTSLQTLTNQVGTLVSKMDQQGKK